MYPQIPRNMLHLGSNPQSYRPKRAQYHPPSKLTPSCSKPESLQQWHQMNESVSLQEFDNYLKRTGLQFFNPNSCTDDKPYKCICIFGPPNVGESEAASSLNTYMNGVRQSTTSAKFYKWTCERNNTNFFHYTNDSFASDTGINWGKLVQSFQSVVFNTPGRHMIAIEGHRLFKSTEVMEKSDHFDWIPTNASIQEATNFSRIFGPVLHPHQPMGQGAESKQADSEN